MFVLRLVYLLLILLTFATKTTAAMFKRVDVSNGVLYDLGKTEG